MRGPPYFKPIDERYTRPVGGLGPSDIRGEVSRQTLLEWLSSIHVFSLPPNRACFSGLGRNVGYTRLYLERKEGFRGEFRYKYAYRHAKNTLMAICLHGGMNRTEGGHFVHWPKKERGRPAKISAGKPGAKRNSSASRIPSQRFNFQSPQRHISEKGKDVEKKTG